MRNTKFTFFLLLLFKYIELFNKIDYVLKTISFKGTLNNLKNFNCFILFSSQNYVIYLDILNNHFCIETLTTFVLYVRRYPL